MGALALVALLAFGLVSKGDGGVTIGEPPAADAALPVLDPTASGEFALADFKGEWVLANVWASWCGPCRDESPALQAFAERNEGDVRVVGIDTQDNTDDALEFVDEFGLTYEQLHDGSGDFADDLGTTGRPGVDPHRPRGQRRLPRARSGDGGDPHRADRTAHPERGLMRRLLLPLIASILLGAPATALGQAPEPQTNLADISDEVMCTVCGVPLELALEAPQAEAERDFIRELIAEGKTKDEVKDALVVEYGENVLAVPGNEGFDLVAWLIPIGAFLVAAIAVVLALRRWRRQRGNEGEQPAAAPADAAGSERLDADMARYDL